MLFRRKKPESKDIRKFVDILYQFEKKSIPMNYVLLRQILSWS